MGFNILLGVPSGGLLTEQSAQASWLCSNDHNVLRLPCCQPGLNFNPLWAEALNRGARGEITHFAMMHADLSVVEDEEGKRWLDRLVEEMEFKGVPFLSVPNAIKDARGVTSCGVGDPLDRWVPFRRWTLRDLEALPMTFTASEVGYRDKFLLHNEALCLMDMRDPRWYVPDRFGKCRFLFGVYEDVSLLGDVWVRRQETEDWSFSRDVWLAGIPSAITRRVKMYHLGQVPFPNHGDVGEFRNGDENLAGKWRAFAPANSTSTDTAAV
jgi:hypothetical protein